jgi:hypothetical protein
VAAAAAALALWLAVSPERRAGLETRTKGNPTIGFYVKHGDAVRRGGAGEVVFPRDALDFTASTDRPRYLAIISIDGAGVASAYYPGGAIASHLPAGQDQLLPLSVALDDTLGIERLVGVFCDVALPIAQLRDAIAHGVALPAGCSADALTIEKRAP